MTDRLLLQEFVEHRDQSAFAALVARHGGMVYATARRLSRDDAEDVAQAVFLILSRKASGLTRHENLAGWLYETTRNCASNANRQRRRHDAKLNAAREVAMSDTTSSIENTALIEQLDQGLSNLSTKYKQVLLMRYMENLSVEQTAMQLRLTPAAVMKRATRGLSQLREFFRRHGNQTTLESVAGCMITQAVQLNDDQHARFASVVKGGTTPSAMALASSTHVLAHIVGINTVGVVVATILAAVAIGVRMIENNPAATLPALTPAIVSDPRATADQFLTALATGNVEEIARYISLGDDLKSRALAQTYVNNYRNAIYSRFPKRLKINGFNVTADNTGKPLGGMFYVMTPTDAEIGHLLLTVGPKNGHWTVTSVTYTDTETRFVQPSGVDTFDYAKAQTAYAVFIGLNQTMDINSLTLVDIDKSRQGLRDLAAAMKGSDLAPSSDDIRAADTELARSHDIFLKDGVEGMKKETARCMKDEKLRQAMSRLMSIAGQIQARVDQQHDAHHAKPRPVSVESDIKLNDQQREMRIPGPLKFPEWLCSTAAYKQWQSVHNIEMFITRDDENNTYTVAAQGWAKNADGSTREIISQIHMYRADGTLAEMTNWGIDGDLQDWSTVDTTGKHLLWKMEQHRRNNGKSSVSRVTEFDKDGNEKVYGISQDGEVNYHAALANPIGE